MRSRGNLSIAQVFSQDLSGDSLLEVKQQYRGDRPRFRPSDGFTADWLEGWIRMYPPDADPETARYGHTGRYQRMLAHRERVFANVTEEGSILCPAQPSKSSKTATPPSGAPTAKHSGRRTGSEGGCTRARRTS